MKRIVDNAAADHHLIPEMYVAVQSISRRDRRPQRSTPMVGHGAETYILDMLDLDAQKQGSAKNPQ